MQNNVLKMKYQNQKLQIIIGVYFLFKKEMFLNLLITQLIIKFLYFKIITKANEKHIR